jgi:hypothetical protein
MKVSRKVGRRNRSSILRRRLRNKKTKNGYRKKHTQKGAKRGRGYKRAHTYKRVHRGGLSPNLHRQNGGIVEVFLMYSAYLGEHELTYSKSSVFSSNNVTKKFHVYYQKLDGDKLYLLRIKDDKFQRLLCLDAITDLENFDTGNLGELKFKSLDIQTGKDTGVIYKFNKNNQNNVNTFNKISDALSMPPLPLPINA